MLYIKLISVYIILLVVGYTSRKNDFFFFAGGGEGGGGLPVYFVSTLCQNTGKKVF